MTVAMACRALGRAFVSAAAKRSLQLLLEDRLDEDGAPAGGPHLRQGQRRHRWPVARMARSRYLPSWRDLLGGSSRRSVLRWHPEITPPTNFHHVRDTTRAVRLASFASDAIERIRETSHADCGVIVEFGGARIASDQLTRLKCERRSCIVTRRAGAKPCQRMPGSSTAMRSLVNGARTARLTRKAGDVLACLIRHRGRVVSQELLLREVWPNLHVTPDLVRETSRPAQRAGRRPLDRPP